MEFSLFDQRCFCRFFTSISSHRRVLNSAASDESLESAPYKLRRRNSETLRAQYINTKELRFVV